MEIDWTLAKKITLWQYEELIQKMFEVLAYGFVHKHYNHGMADAAAYSEKIQHNYLLNGKEATFISNITNQIKTLNILGIKNYDDLLIQIYTKDKCESFLKISGFNFETLLHLLNFVFRWVLPFKIPVTELVNIIPSENDYLPILKKFKIGSNLDVLGKWHTIEGREQFCKETGVNELFVLQLTHRADISRLAYVRGKTIKHLCGGGYDTLKKIASAHITKMHADMTEYYAKLGKKFSDSKAVLPLDWMIGGARILPKIVEV